MASNRFSKTIIGLMLALTLGTGFSGVGATLLADKLVINIPSRTLWVYSGDRIVQYFPVGVGRPGFMTPLGRFSVIRKILDPGWEHPYQTKGSAVRIAPGENNPLGSRWIGFYQKSGGEYGMHGTDNPASVGRFSSHGCVRLKTADVEKLFEMVDLGTPVEVVYQPVLIRRSGNDIRLIVYRDVFRQGMPNPEAIQADILKQFPSARVDAVKIRAALAQPTEKPFVVGTALPDTNSRMAETEPAPDKAGPMARPATWPQPPEPIETTTIGPVPN